MCGSQDLLEKLQATDSITTVQSVAGAETFLFNTTFRLAGVWSSDSYSVSTGGSLLRGKAV